MGVSLVVYRVVGLHTGLSTCRVFPLSMGMRSMAEEVGEVYVWVCIIRFTESSDAVDFFPLFIMGVWGGARVFFMCFVSCMDREHTRHEDIAFPFSSILHTTFYNSVPLVMSDGTASEL